MNATSERSRSPRAVQATGAPAATGPYSPGVVAGDLLFLAGQASFDEGGRFVAGSVGEQTALALKNLDAVARAAGASLRSAVRVGVYLRSTSAWGEMNEAYAAFFAGLDPLPARTAIQSALDGFDVEIDAVVWLGAGKVLG